MYPYNILHFFLLPTYITKNNLKKITPQKRSLLE